MVFQSQTSFYRGRLARALELAEEATRRAGTPVRRALPAAPAHPGAVAGHRSRHRPARGHRAGPARGRSAKRKRWAWAGPLPHWHAARACALLEQGALDDAAVEAESSLMVAGELEITLPNPQARLPYWHWWRSDAVTSPRPKTTSAPPKPVPARTRGSATALRCLSRAPASQTRRAKTAKRRRHSRQASKAVSRRGCSPYLVPLAGIRAHRAPRQGPVARAGRVRRTASLTAQDESRQIIGAVRTHVDGLLHRDPRALASAITGYRHTGRPLARSGLRGPRRAHGGIGRHDAGRSRTSKKPAGWHRPQEPGATRNGSGGACVGSACAPVPCATTRPAPRGWGA